MNQFIKKKVYGSFRILIFIFPITFLLYLFFSDYGQFGNFLFLSKKLFFEINLGLFLVSIGYLIRYFRWKLILNSFGFYPSAKTESKLWLASYSFTATPGKLGELIRCYFLRKIFNIPLKYSFFSIIFERLFDLIAVLIILVCYLIFYHQDFIFSLEKKFFIGSALSIFLILSLRIKLIDLKKIIKNFFDIKFKFFGNIFKIREISELNNLENLLKLNVLIKISFLSLISWSLEGIAFFFLLRKLNFDISILSSTFIHTSAGLIGALTLLPGGIGSTEALTVYILKSHTIPIHYGIPITSIIRLMTIWYITLIGSIALFIIRKKVFKND